MPALADASQRWVDLRPRILSAAVLAPVVLAFIWYGGTPFLVLMAAAALGLSIEWSRVIGWDLTSTAAMVQAVGMVIAVVAAGLDHAGLALGVLAVGLIALAAVIPRDRWLPALFGLPYIGLGIAALAWLRADPVVGREDLFFLVVLVWASDIGAYMSGRIFGGPRLAPLISPSKTWSGAIGGLVVAVSVALATSFMIQAPGSVVATVAMAAMLGIVAQGGDLFESAIKRHAGAKDSGHLIPGHGGLLDRLDALLAAAPVAALLALVAGRGVVLWQ